MLAVSPSEQLLMIIYWAVELYYPCSVTYMWNKILTLIWQIPSQRIFWEKSHLPWAPSFDISVEISALILAHDQVTTLIPRFKDW